MKVTNNSLLKISLSCLLISASLVAWSQSILRGKVTDQESGEGLPGVTILVKGASQGTTTDLDGSYSLSLDSENAVLVFSFVGYRTEEVLVAGRTVIDLRMREDLQALDEIIVTGYGTQKKSVVTASIAKIDAKALERNKDLRVEQAIQGRAAGVMVMNNSGQPGDNLTIRIRGTGTNSDPDPLFIIDGLPLEKTGLDFLNPADIASIEILKDAAAAAIYGTRGANGVVLITTKQGKKGSKMQVSYSGFYGVQTPWRKMDLLNAEQYIEIMNEAQANDGKSAPLFPTSMTDTINWSTDWQDEMYYYYAPKTSHTVNITGGSEAGTYSSSINYYKQDGIVAKGKSEFERFTYRLGTTRDLNKLNISSNINLVHIANKGIEGNSQYGTGINQALNMPPIVPVTYSNGVWGTPNDFGVGLQEITNPVALLSVINRETKSYKALGNLAVEYEIVKGLKFRSNYSGEAAFVNYASYTPAYFINTTNQRQVNNAARSVDRYLRWNWDNTLSYEFAIKQSTFKMLGGTTRFQETSENFWASKDSLIFDSFDKSYLNNSTQIEGLINNGFTNHTLQSFFGRINYNFAERYLFEGVFRADGSSRFGANHKYAYFPAVAVGWVFSEESFLTLPKWFEFGKVRASWGQNGNERIGDFQFSSIVSNGHSYFFGNGQVLNDGIQPAFYSNPDLRWEASEQLNFGVDLSLFRGKFSLGLDYYEKRTKDWIVDGGTAFPKLIGNIPPPINGGGAKNAGFELEMNYKDNLSEDLYLSITFTGSTNKGQVTHIDNAGGELLGGEGVKGQDEIQRAAVGQPIGYFWGYKTAGIVQHPAELEDLAHQPNAKVGDLIFRDLNNDGKLDDKDRTNIGNPFPDFVLGLNTSVDYKNFDLSMFWYSALGHQIWRANRRNDLRFANYTTEVLDRWTGEGSSNEVPRVTIDDPNRSWIRPSDFFVEDADFLRLKNITLGYTLPKTVLKSIGIESVRMYVTSENLLTFTKYSGLEVEIGGGPLTMGIDQGVYPQSRTFLGGMNITF